MRLCRATVLFLAISGSVACSDAAGPDSEPSTMVMLSGDGQESVTPNGSQVAVGLGILPDSLRVRVFTRFGSPAQGARVTWTTTAGTIAPSSATTDSTGTIAARWSWFSPQKGFASAGDYIATATLPNGAAITFTGHARVGVALRDVRITPDTVSVASGPAQVTVTLRTTDDRTTTVISEAFVVFFGPSGAPPGLGATLTRVSGTQASGTWQGTLTLPAGSDPGDWKLGRVTLSWGCGAANRVELTGTTLDSLALPMRVHVKGAVGQSSGFPAPSLRTTAGPAERDTRSQGRSEVASSC